MRKIIQVATMPRTGDKSELFALCDDGTLWVLEEEYGEWIDVKPIPQDEPQK